MKIIVIGQKNYESLSVALSTHRDSYWPNGILAETPPRRDKGIRMRTRVAAKTSLLGIMPGTNTHTQTHLIWIFSSVLWSCLIYLVLVLEAFCFVQLKHTVRKHLRSSINFIKRFVFVYYLLFPKLQFSPTIMSRVFRGQ